ncbi:aminotransferase class III-fold pyridoxal phosphate-dependent enzyme [Alphaproteobacteria bacterium]|nr:aminotransferase class III-fold pyridoxal phosphate-dependent enzyme [Alphaproteobacteria bacterium]
MTSFAAIIQGRMGSSRLPGKTLLPFGDTTVLGYMIERLKMSTQLDEIIVATTSCKIDDDIEKCAIANGVKVFRGDETDLLGRYVGAANVCRSEAFVRLTADCPLIDPHVIDHAVLLFQENNYDYLSNVVSRSYPDGVDVEIFTKKALLKANKECSDPWAREHVTPYMRNDKNLGVRGGNFVTGEFHAQCDFSHLRWTLDNEDDYQFLKIVASYDVKHKGWMEIISLLTRKPELLLWSERHVSKHELEVKLKKKVLNTNFKHSKQHYKKALAIIPGASQTVSKSVKSWGYLNGPYFGTHAVGALITDVDSNVYVDYLMALLPVVLGYGDPSVDAAVVEQMHKGVSISLPSKLEVVLSEKLIELIPCAEMVRFGKNGSDATTAAVRIARVSTGRDIILICGYHGWHDWHVSTMQASNGVPKSVQGLSISIPFNDHERLKETFQKYGDKIAGIIMEPAGKVAPEISFLELSRSLSFKYGSLLIFDEIITGFRVSLGGAQLAYGVIPDLATFGKGMANGYPISALVGKKEFMSSMDNTFVSTTFGGELASIAASIATIEQMELRNAISRTHQTGNSLIKIIGKSVSDFGLLDIFSFGGEGWWPRLEIKTDEFPQNQMLVYLRSRFVKHKLLIASGLNLSLAHSDPHIIDITKKQFEKAFDEISSEVSLSNFPTILGAEFNQKIVNVR